MRLLVLLCFTLLSQAQRVKEVKCWIEDQKNPDVMDMRLEGHKVAEDIISSYNTPEEKQPGLMKILKKINGVEGLYFQEHVITVVRTGQRKWKELMGDVIQAINQTLSVQLKPQDPLPDAFKDKPK